MKPFFRAVGPAFHKNLEVGPFETVNIYSLMCHILGIKPEVNDGNLDNVKHMLVTSANERGINVNVLQNIFTGLAAVAGFMVVVFVVMTSHIIIKNKRKKEKIPEKNSKQIPEREFTQQTSF